MSGKQPKRLPRPGVDEYGRTPLHYAAGDGDLPKVVTLLAGGAAIDLQDDNGWTALHFAAQARSEEVARYLLAHGASVELADSFGNTALFEATFSSRGDGAIIRALRAAGADPLRKNKTGVSPVSLARTIGNYNVAQFYDDLKEA